MCKYNVTIEKDIGFIAREYAECGLCDKREWCPIYMVAVKNTVQRYLEEPTVDEALERAKSNYRMIRDKDRQYVVEGAISILEHRDDKVKLITFDKGKKYLRDLLFNEDMVTQFQKLILLEERSI